MYDSSVLLHLPSENIAQLKHFRAENNKSALLPTIKVLRVIICLVITFKWRREVYKNLYRLYRELTKLNECFRSINI